MNTIQTVRDMHAWLRWCTGRSMDAARTLSAEELAREFPMGIGSVMATLVHLYGAEKLWFAALTSDPAALQGQSPAIAFPTVKDFPTLDSLAAAWRPVRANWDAYLGALNDAEMNRIVIRVREGKEFKQRVVDGLLQVPTHALYHNAQLSAMFRQMGRTLPDSSYIIWARERMSAATPVPA